jgi:mannose/fructose-specific phosphotransferase system component IIA
MTSALIVTHGKLGCCLKNAAERIIGSADRLDCLSNEGLSLAQLTEAVSRHVSTCDTDLFIYSDFKGGSCYNAVRRAILANPQQKVWHLSGINLPMLLAFLNKRITLSGRELLEAVRERALAGIIVDEVAE